MQPSPGMLYERVLTSSCAQHHSAGGAPPLKGTVRQSMLQDRVLRVPLEQLTSYIKFIYTFFLILDYVRGIGNWLPIASRGSDCEGPVPASASNGDCQPRHYCPSFKDVHGHRLQLRGIAVNTRLVTGVQISSPNFKNLLS